MTIEILVKLLDGKQVALKLNEHDCIETIKEIIFAEMKIPMNLQQLIYKNRELDDNITLDKSGIYDQALINLYVTKSISH